MGEAPQGGESADARLWRDELRGLTGGLNLVVLLVAIALGVIGVFDSMTDADGERIWGAGIVAAPSIYAVWCVLEPAWRRRPALGALLLRIMSGCLLAPLLVAVPVAVVQAVAVAFPGVRDMIVAAGQANGGFHYYWEEGFGAQLLMVPLAGWGVGAFAALMAVMIISLPVISLRAPGVVSVGSRLEKIEGAGQARASAMVFCGLSVLILGVCLWVFSDGDSIAEAPQALIDVIAAWTRYGTIWWDEVLWLLGVLCVLIGIGLFCAAVVVATRAGRRSTREG